MLYLLATTISLTRCSFTISHDVSSPSGHSKGIDHGVRSDELPQFYGQLLPQLPESVISTTTTTGGFTELLALDHPSHDQAVAIIVGGEEDIPIDVPGSGGCGIFMVRRQQFTECDGFIGLWIIPP